MYDELCVNQVEEFLVHIRHSIPQPGAYTVVPKVPF